jgi:hypothetical protein
MSGPRAPVEVIAFPAPVGRRVRVVTVLSVAVIPFFCLLDFFLYRTLHLRSPAFWPMILAPTVGLVVVLPIVFFQRVLRYRVTSDALEVVRPGRVNRFPFADLQAVNVDPRAMEWAFKIFGNDGAGAITGQFRSRKLGVFRALVTDRDRSVVLRWPDLTLVVSPDRPEEFADAVRARAAWRH